MASFEQLYELTLLGFTTGRCSESEFRDQIKELVSKFNITIHGDEIIQNTNKKGSKDTDINIQVDLFVKHAKSRIESNKKLGANKKVYVVIFWLYVLFSFIISFTTGEKNTVYGFILFSVVGFFWWAIKIGTRSGILFFAPYLLFLIGIVFLTEGLKAEQIRQGNNTDGMTISYWVFGIVETIGFLLEYFFAQPKCVKCGKRTTLKKINESNLDSFTHWGTKTYSIKDNSGNKIGSYEGIVEQTTFTFIGNYTCSNCGTITSRRESRTY